MSKIFYGWWVVLACFLISFYVSGVIFFGFTAFFEPIRKEFGWSYTQISLAAGLRGLEMGIFAPLIGFLVDRFGSRALIFSGILTVGAGLILLSMTQGLIMFYGAFLLLAFGAGGCTSVVTITAVANWFHKKMGIALGVMASGFGAGGLMVPLIVYLIDVYDWRVTFTILGLGMWALGIPLSFVIRNKPEQYGCLPDGEISMEPVSNPETQGSETKIGFKEALKNKSFIYLNMAEAIRMMVVVAVITHIMPYLSSIGTRRSTATFIAAAIPLYSITGRISFGWLGDIFGKRCMLAWAFFFMGMGVLALGYAKGFWVILIFILLFSPGHGGSVVLRGAILREYFGRSYLGTMLGITMGSASIGGIIGPTIAGLIFDALGSYHLIWFIFSGITILAIGLILKIR